MVHTASDRAVALTLDDRREKPRKVSAPHVVGRNARVTREGPDEHPGLFRLELFVAPRPQALQTEAVFFETIRRPREALGGIAKGCGRRVHPRSYPILVP